MPKIPFLSSIFASLRRMIQASTKPVVFLLAVIIVGTQFHPFSELFVIRISAIGTLLCISVGLLLEIHKIVLEKKEEEVYTDFVDAENDYKNVLRTAFEDRRPMLIKMLGVALHYSWPATSECIYNYYNKNGSFPKGIEIEISILDRKWLNKNISAPNANWKGRSNHFFCEFFTFLNDYKDHIILNGVALNENRNSVEKLKITFSCYSYTPNWHGILLEISKRSGAKYYDFFLSHCAWGKGGKLLVGENPYKRLRSKKDNEDEINQEIAQYNGWFSYRNHVCTYREIEKVAAEANHVDETA